MSFGRIRPVQLSRTSGHTRMMFLANRQSIALLVALFALTGCAQGPESSVKSLGKAFRDQDRLRVTRYMDVDRTSTSITSTLMAEVTQKKGQDSTGEAGRAGDILGTAMLGAMQPALTAYVRQMIYFLADSSAPLPSFGSENGGAPTSRAEVRDSLAKRQFEVRKARTEGDVAVVPVFIPATPGQSDSGTVELRLEKAGKNWRVVGVERLPEGALGSVAPKMR
jgi:DUF2939 family protein